MALPQLLHDLQPRNPLVVPLDLSPQLVEHLLLHIDAANERQKHRADDRHDGHDDGNMLLKIRHGGTTLKLTSLE
jgi:hypothetical protein